MPFNRASLRRRKRGRLAACIGAMACRRCDAAALIGCHARPLLTSRESSEDVEVVNRWQEINDTWGHLPTHPADFHDDDVV